MAINLGDKVRDTVTGLEGIVTSRSEFLNGCIRVGIQPQEVKDGKPADSVWVDEPQCEVVKAAVVEGFGDRLKAAAGRLMRTGGPREDARRAQDAKR